MKLRRPNGADRRPIERGVTPKRRRILSLVFLSFGILPITINALQCTLCSAQFDFNTIPAGCAFTLIGGIIRNGGVPNKLMWPLRIIGIGLWIGSFFTSSALFVAGIICYAAAELSGNFWMQSVSNAQMAMKKSLNRSMKLRGNK